MKFSVVCPNRDCGKSYLVAESYLGRRGECKQCGTKFTFTPSGSWPDSGGRNTPSGAARETGSASTAMKTLKVINGEPAQGYLGRLRDNPPAATPENDDPAVDGAAGDDVMTDDLFQDG